jgi:predicted metal-dependent phosphoesterase TrpH
MRGLIHCHTYHSFDCLLPPEVYLWKAASARLDFLCICDHNTLAGSLQAKAKNRNARLEVVVGAEYQTDLGDIIGLFLEREVRSRQWRDVISEIHDQGGIALLPHPFKGHRQVEVLLEAVDLVEVFNARCDERSNDRARLAADRLRKPTSAGADIHTVYELVRGGALVDLQGDGPLREQLLRAPRVFETRRVGRNIQRYSEAVKRLRKLIGLPGHL